MHHPHNSLHKFKAETVKIIWRLKKIWRNDTFSHGQGRPNLLPSKVHSTHHITGRTPTDPPPLPHRIMPRLQDARPLHHIINDVKVPLYNGTTRTLTTKSGRSQALEITLHQSFCCSRSSSCTVQRFFYSDTTVLEKHGFPLLP